MTRAPEFARVKAEASFEQILEHYGLKASGAGAQRMALCPFHADTKPSCSIHLVHKVFHCFGCGARGSVLDFVARMERISIPEAASLVAEICRIRADPAQSRCAGHEHTRSTQTRAEPCKRPLPPKLDLRPTHPYLAERGVGPELAATFGLGYCHQGFWKGRICIPIHDERGTLVGYAGRWASRNVPTGVPKYQLPRGFEKRLLLFNLHRVAGMEHVVLVEGYWSVFRLHALETSAVALMGRMLSTEQEALLLRSGVRTLTLLLDGDAPGRQATEELLPRLARCFFVRVIDLPDGAEPDTVPEQFLINALSP
jgi:DNA primase